MSWKEKKKKRLEKWRNVFHVGQTASLTDKSHIVLWLKCFNCGERGSETKVRFEAQRRYAAKAENACYLPNKEVTKLLESKLLSSTKWSEACMLLQAVNYVRMQHTSSCTAIY